MAVSLGEAIVYILGDDSGLNQVLGRSQSRLGQFATNSGRAIQRGIGTATQTTVAGTAAAITGLGAAIYTSTQKSGKLNQTVADIASVMRV